MDEEVTFDKISSVEKILFSLGIHTFVTSSSVRHSPATFPAGEGSFAPPRGGAVRVLNPFYKYPFMFAVSRVTFVYPCYRNGHIVKRGIAVGGIC